MLANVRGQCVNPGPLISNTAFRLQAGYGGHGVSQAQMWTGPNTHQLPNMKKCGSNSVQRATLSHPLWGCYFSLKSTADMIEGWEKRRRQDQGRAVYETGSWVRLWPPPLPEGHSGPIYLSRLKSISLELTPFASKPFIVFLLRSLIISESCWVKSVESRPLSFLLPAC